MLRRTQTLLFSLLPALLVTSCDTGSEITANTSTPSLARHQHVHPAGIIVTSVPGYARITSAWASETPGSITLSVTPQARPPRRVEEVFGGNAVFGYAWVDLDTFTGIAATIHPSFRDSRQNPHGWHTHVIQLAAGAGGADFCLVSASANTPGGISIRPHEVRVHMAKRHAGISASALDVAVAFFVAGEGSCGSGLGVHLSGDPQPL